MRTGTARLGDLYEFLPKSPLKASDGGPEGAYPFFTSSPHQAKWTDAPLFDAEALVFATGGAAAVHHVAGQFAASADCLVATPRRANSVDPRFSYHYLNWNIGALEAGFRGAGLRHVPKRFIEELALPASTITEQRRIAEILDKADALRAKRRAALAQLDTLTQSIFLDMFGDPATNPKGWPVARIGYVTECLDRLRRPVTESDRNPGKVPYYGANGQQGWMDAALFDEPLVLVAEDGGYFDAPHRGVAYRIDGPAWVNNHAHILRAKPRHVDAEFLHRALRHFNFLSYISGTTRAKLTQGQLNAVKLFVPPVVLQREFGERVAGIQRIERVTAASGDQLDALFASLQHRAFRGDL